MWVGSKRTGKNRNHRKSPRFGEQSIKKLKSFSSDRLTFPPVCAGQLDLCLFYQHSKHSVLDDKLIIRSSFQDSESRGSLPSLVFSGQNTWVELLAITKLISYIRPHCFLFKLFTCYESCHIVTEKPSKSTTFSCFWKNSNVKKNPFLMHMHVIQLPRKQVPHIG